MALTGNLDTEITGTMNYQNKDLVVSKDSRYFNIPLVSRTGFWIQVLTSGGNDRDSGY